MHNICALYLCAISVHKPQIHIFLTARFNLNSSPSSSDLHSSFISSAGIYLFNSLQSTLLSLLLFKEKKKIQAESKSSQYFDTWQKMFCVWSYPLEDQRACTAETAPVQIRLPRLFSLKSILILRANDRLNQNQPSLSPQDHNQLWSSILCCLCTFALLVNLCSVGQLVLCWSTCALSVNLCSVGQLVLCGSTCAPLVNLSSVGQLVLCWSTCAVGQIVLYWSTCALLVNLCSVGQLVLCWSTCALSVNLCSVGQLVLCGSTCAPLVNLSSVGQLVLCRINLCSVGQLVLCWSTCAPSVTLCSVGQLALHRSTSALSVNLCSVGQLALCRSTCALSVNLCSVGQLVLCWSTSAPSAILCSVDHFVVLYWLNWFTMLQHVSTIVEIVMLSLLIIISQVTVVDPHEICCQLLGFDPFSNMCIVSINSFNLRVISQTLFWINVWLI